MSNGRTVDRFPTGEQIQIQIQIQTTLLIPEGQFFRGSPSNHHTMMHSVSKHTVYGTVRSSLVDKKEESDE